MPAPSPPVYLPRPAPNQRDRVGPIAQGSLSYRPAGVVHSTGRKKSVRCKDILASHLTNVFPLGCILVCPSPIMGPTFGSSIKICLQNWLRLWPVAKFSDCVRQHEHNNKQIRALKEVKQMMITKGQSNIHKLTILLDLL